MLMMSHSLYHDTARLTVDKLKTNLSRLWGELASKKDSFLHAHPHIKPDEDFSALKYNITTDNIPFDACIAEYGVNTSDREGKQEWIRIFKLFGTRIKP